MLDSFSDKGVDLYYFLREQLESLKSQEYRKPDTQEVLQVGRVGAGKRQVEGLVEIGQYGNESVIRNLDRCNIGQTFGISASVQP